MIRLATPDFDRLETTATLDMSIGGTESNVAVALARLGRRATWLSALPANPLGRRIAATLRFHGVDVSHVIWSQTARAGLYFLEPGSAPRPTRVIYDRTNSAIATIDPDDVPYELVDDSRLLHLTGITPALSEQCAEACRRLVERAAGQSVPLDVRRQLPQLALVTSRSCRGHSILPGSRRSALLRPGRCAHDLGTGRKFRRSRAQPARQIERAASSSLPPEMPAQPQSTATVTSTTSPPLPSTSSTPSEQATPSPRVSCIVGSATQTTSLALSVAPSPRPASR